MMLSDGSHVSVRAWGMKMTEWQLPVGAVLLVGVGVQRDTSWTENARYRLVISAHTTYSTLLQWTSAVHHLTCEQLKTVLDTAGNICAN